MRIVEILVIAIAMAGTLSSAARGEMPQGEWHSTLEAARKQSQQSRQPLLLFVTMDDCAYCKKMARHTFADESVQSDLESTYVAAAIDGTKQPQLATLLQVRAYPATFLVSPDSQVVDRIDGYVTPQALRQRMERALRAIADLEPRQAKHSRP